MVQSLLVGIVEGRHEVRRVGRSVQRASEVARSDLPPVRAKGLSGRLGENEDVTTIAWSGHRERTTRRSRLSRLAFLQRAHELGRGDARPPRQNSLLGCV